MAGESQAFFLPTVKNAICKIYSYRCVICLNMVRPSQCAHIIDAATQGLHQVRCETMMQYCLTLVVPQVHNGVKLGILPESYKRNAETMALFVSEDICQFI
jgi:hypothetical protein